MSVFEQRVRGYMHKDNEWDGGVVAGLEDARESVCASARMLYWVQVVWRVRLCLISP